MWNGHWSCRLLGSISISTWPIASVSGWHTACGVPAAKLLLQAALPLALRLPFMQHALLQIICLAPLLYGCSQNCAELAAAEQGASFASTFVQLVQVRSCSCP